MKGNCWRIGKICRNLVLYYANSTQYCSKVRRTGKKMMSAENKHIGKKKKELVLILVILAVSALLYAGTRIIFSKPPMRVEISVDGTVIETLDLNKDTELTVEGWNDGTNHVVIKDGTVHVTKASCPDKVCVNQGTIRRTGEAIICLPNRMIARITGGE